VIDHDRLTLRAVFFVTEANFLRAADGVLGVTAGVAPALGGEGLVVVLTKVHAELLPCVEVARGGDGSRAGALALPVADVLGEGGGADNGRLVHLGVLPDVVDGAVAGDGAHLLALSGSSAVAGVLLDVVLDKRVLGPSVDGDKDSAGVSGGGTLEVDLAGGSRLPSLSNDEVASVGELDGVAVVAGAEVDVAAGLVVLVVVLATCEAVGVELKVGSISYGDWVGSWGGEGADSGGESKDEGGESNHFDDVVWWLVERECVIVCCVENEVLVMLDVCLRATRLWFIYAKCLSTG
jgi:hypothetical protein